MVMERRLRFCSHIDRSAPNEDNHRAVAMTACEIDIFPAVNGRVLRNWRTNCEITDFIQLSLKLPF